MALVIRTVLSAAERASIAHSTDNTEVRTGTTAAKKRGFQAKQRINAKSTLLITSSGSLISRPLSCKDVAAIATETDAKSAMLASYVATGLLALSNPLMIIGLVAAFTAFGLCGSSCQWQVAVGMFCGSALWWTALCVAATAFRDMLSSGTMSCMNRLACVLMAGLGLLSIVSIM